MSEARVLVLHDDATVRAVASEALAILGAVEALQHPAELLQALAAHDPVHMVLIEHGARCANGDYLLDRLRQEHPELAVLVVGEEDTPEPALAAVRAGASGFLSAPVSPAGLVASAERALTFRKLAHEKEQLRTRVETADSCARLLRCLDPATVYAVALDLLLGGTGRSRGLAHFRRPALPGSDGLVFRGFSRSDGQRVRQSLSRTEPPDHRTIHQPDVVSSGPMHSVLRDLGVEDPGAALTVGLSGEERETGVLYVFNDGAPFLDTELERARVIADYGQLALDNAERYQGAKARALIDDATGLHNVRYLLDSADHEIERAARYGFELSILFVDIDRFKQVNDVHGHLIGTSTLRHVGERLSDCVRQIDTLARYGGDEFTILLTDTSAAGAHAAAERIRQNVAESAYRDAQGNQVDVTVSIGVACYPHDSRSRDELVDLADKAMYRAKSMGRNRVALAEELVRG